MFKDMKTSFYHFIIPSFLLAVMLTMSGCWTEIRTVAPVATPVVVPVQTVYSTTVTTPKPKVTTVTTVTVTNYNTDMSFYLDLNAVAAAFAESRSVQEFEQLLNSSRYMINNLDLNHDGWIDYLRVIETHKGVYHTMLIQACLAPSVYQDVATLVAEHRPTALYVEVIGDRWLYGPNYIVRPVFIKRPPIWDVFGRPQYASWSSPYYYNYWPSYFQKPKPIYLNHYQAYVKTYLRDHHYCHQCDYPSQPFYNGYSQMTQPNTRNDYATQHPDNSFERRVTNTLSGSGVTIRNAGELRVETERQTVTTTTRSSGSSSSDNRGSGSTVTQRTSGGSTSSTSSTSTTSTTRTTSGSTGSTSSTRSGTTTRVSGTTTRQPSTSVESRVNRSGATRTTIKTTDENGRTQTVQRTSSTATRSSSATTTTRSAGTTSGTTTRSSGSTTREASGSTNTTGSTNTRQAGGSATRR